MFFQIVVVILLLCIFDRIYRINEFFENVMNKIRVVNYNNNNDEDSLNGEE